MECDKRDSRAGQVWFIKIEFCTRGFGGSVIGVYLLGNLKGHLMDVQTDFLEFNTQGHTDIIDLTDRVQKKITESGFMEGAALVSAVGSTTGISTVEYEPGLVHHDIKEMLAKLAPYGVPYQHNQTWGDDNGAAHLRSTFTGTSQTYPFQDGKLILGTWQQIIFVDYDTRPRRRKVVVQIWGK